MQRRSACAIAMLLIVALAGAAGIAGSADLSDQADHDHRPVRGRRRQRHHGAPAGPAYGPRARPAIRDRQPRRRRRYARRACRGQVHARWPHPHGRPFRRVRGRAQPLCKRWLRSTQGFCPDRPHRLVPADPGRASFAAGAQRQGPAGARPQGARQDHLCDRRHWLWLAYLDRAVQFDGRHQAHPRPLPRQRAGAERSHRRPRPDGDHDRAASDRADPQRAPARVRGHRRHPPRHSCPTCRRSPNSACPAMSP